MTLALRFPRVGRRHSFGFAQGPGRALSPSKGGAVYRTYAPSAGAPVVAAPVAFSAGKYRYQSDYLFQTARSPSEPTRMAGGSSLNNDTRGPWYQEVADGWEWTNNGGDWIDSAGTPQGSASWIVVRANLGSGSSGPSAVYAYSVDCTAAIKHVVNTGRWNAYHVRCMTAERTIAANYNPTYPGPRIDVTYVNGSTGTLGCRLAARSNGTTTVRLSTADTVKLPGFFEFDRPIADVQSATLYFTVTQHYSGSTPDIRWDFCNPPINVEPTELGIANAAPLDASLPGHPSIIGVHRYLDGTNILDFAMPSGGPSVSASRNYDPYIYQGSPTHDYTKYPHLGLGKFINAPLTDGVLAAWSVVNSDYSAEGFKPLAPGMGALRTPMIHHSYVVDGFNNNNYNGTSNGACHLYMPEPLFGYLDHIFVRYYMRIGTPNGQPYRMPVLQRYQMSQDPGSTWLWADCSGKAGITPTHLTEDGGNSGGAGGGWGWQWRLRWADFTGDDKGPEIDGWRMGLHTYDYLNFNPSGYNYGSASAQFNDSFSAKGGLGGHMRADQWYCIEMELKLNTVFPSDVPKTGYLPDGWMKVWVDGRLALEKQNLVTRTLPLQSSSGIGTEDNPLPYAANGCQPIRELGVKSLWFGWYHGGLTENTLPRTVFISGLAWGTEYIGPMNIPPPSWVPAAGSLANITSLAGNTFESVVDTAKGYVAGQSVAVVNDYSSHPTNPYWGTYGGIMAHGAGHAGSNDRSTMVFEFDTMRWKRIADPYDVSSGTVDSDFSLITDPITGEHPDGQPAAFHSYDLLDIIPPQYGGGERGTLVSPVRSALNGKGIPYNVKAAHRLDLTNGTGPFLWTRIGTPGTPAGTYTGAGCAFDRRRNRVWYGVVPSSPTSTIRWIDIGTGSWGSQAHAGEIIYAASGGQNSGIMRYDDVHDALIYTCGNSTSTRIAYMLCANPAAGWVEKTSTLNIPLVTGTQTPFTYVAPINKWLMIGRMDLNNVYEITIPSDISQPWSVFARPVVGGALPYWPDGTLTGKCWTYIPQLKCIPLLAKLPNIYVYRPFGV